ncbi:hypothetical protein CG08_1443 [Riemerella anatipestifer]|uniref:Uncharacterized protein n=2 Tax=Riemerella anatipestifer TaxID=34085 RepID=J9QXY5_RIEAN|nr:hypothetical protein RIA_0924 [Riemerella anatipestifer RA-GD]AFD56459.1 hypothetical protein RA0C_1567 [Riemerella anatipestifer ATCC 11845 = DSM 15868]AFR35195.1 hypothetical protein B739_0591 [Riemerella anatipestifer RA-CH-1]AGC39611.1 hypothetical protein G148_0306 [Riemerella anatipestifer RA-CH-2]AIH02213.1 hypothetical protein M949_1044 [Riemerella anatipestifer CH3]AKP69651.1 hypothetical protein CG08_1443 [Riemerella anatipestifer]
MSIYIDYQISKNNIVKINKKTWIELKKVSIFATTKEELSLLE